ncbi:MAG TPA: WD40 repeat domain-containing protein [Stellaceae bacterium]|nr:WD40 repeat domain-containing protein [Stellaceae bacterium]
MLLGAGTDFGGLQIWDLRRRAKLHSISIEGHDVSNPAFSPDGSLVAVGVYGSGSAYLIDVVTGRIIDRRIVSDLGCGSVAFSFDGRYLITPSTGGLMHNRRGTIRVFKVER